MFAPKEMTAVLVILSGFWLLLVSVIVGYKVLFKGEKISIATSIA